MLSTNRIQWLALTGILTGMLLFAGCKQKPAAPQSQSAANEPEVSVVVMKYESVALTTELPGRISPEMVAEIRPQVGGIIQKRLFTEGGEVQAGESLYQIDPAPYQAACDSAKATLQRANANLFATRQKADRYKQLVAVSAISKQDYDDAAASLKQVEADIEVAKAALETARINLAYTRISAPISGRIGRSSVTAGALVTADQDAALATIQKLDPVYVDVTQSSTALLKLKRRIATGRLQGNSLDQAKVRLLLEDGSPYPLEGSLKFSEVTVNRSTGSITLRALFPNPDHLLLPGMFVRGIVQEGVQQQAILVPQRGVSRNQAGDAVALIVDGKNVVKRRVLKTERTVGNAWLVTEGLKPGDKVIVAGLQRIRPGVKVKVATAGGKTAEGRDF